MNGIQFFCLLGLMVVSCAAYPSNSVDERYLPGAPVVLTGEAREKAIQVLSVGLAQLTTGGGPSYKPVSVSQVTSQIVDGVIYTYKAELEVGSDKKECTVQIVLQPWLKVNDNSINVKCDGDNGVDELVR